MSADAMTMVATHPGIEGWRMRQPSPQEFRGFADFVLDAAGISLNETKVALVMRRLSPRMRQLGLGSLRAYTDMVRHDPTGEEMVRMLDLIVTNETHFFREPQHFTYLEQRVLPEWAAAAAEGRRSRVIRSWSAAASTGQEPYTLAMVLLAQLPVEQGWRHEIVATDISTSALATALGAEWPIERAREIPDHYRKRFMLRGTGDRVGRMRATAELRDAVQFGRLNLNHESYEVPGLFDLIFCRNVLIYFTPEGRGAVINRLADRLAPGGLLFVGHAESLHAHRDRLRSVLPTVYTRL